VLTADKVCNGEGTLALTPQCLQVLHESFERILSRRDSRAVNGSLPMSLNEFAGYRELSFMYDIVQVAASLKVSIKISRDHSFPWNAEFWAEPRNLPISVEFLCFHGILRNLVLASDIGDKYGIFWCSSGRRTWFHHEIHDCHSGSDRRNTENVDLSLSEILPVNFVDSCSYQRQKLHIWLGSGGHRKLITICGKFAAVSPGIWQTGTRNLEKFAVENCGP